MCLKLYDPREILPNNTEHPPTLSIIVATGRGLNTRTPRYPTTTPPKARAGPLRCPAEL